MGHRSVSLAHPAGQTEVSRPVSQQVPLCYYRRTDRKGHFRQDIGRVSHKHLAVEKHFVIFLWGEAFLLTVGAFLLTVKLPCLQSLKALLRRTFPL